MNGFLYTLTLQEPVLANSLGGDPNSANSLFYIPGGALRGAFIQKWGGAADAADHEFRRLFLSGDTRFINAYPLLVDQQKQVERIIPAPFTWQIERKPTSGKQKKVYRDPACAKDEKGQLLDTKNVAFSFRLGKKEKLDDGSEGEALLSARPTWQVNIHTQRDAERGRATSEAGAVYRYISLPAGTQLQGAVLTESAADSKKLRGLMGEKSTILLGKARTAGYGAASLELADLPEGWRESGQLFPAVKDVFTVTLLSPALVRDANGQFSLDLAPALAARLGIQPGQVEVVSRSVEVVGGFNRTWGLPLPTVTAIAAGSVFRVKAQVPEQKLRDLEASGLGERRAEGFGRVAINLELPADEIPWKPVDLALAGEPTGSLPAKDPLAALMLTRLLRRDLDEKLVHAARSAVAGYGGNVPNSQLSRWRVILRDSIGKIGTEIEENGEKKKFDPIQRVHKFCLESKGKAGWKKMEKARVKIGNTTPRLTEWIESMLEQPASLHTALGVDETLERRLGSNSIKMSDLNAEYRLRLLDAVLAMLAKQNGKGGAHG